MLVDILPPMAIPPLVGKVSAFACGEKTTESNMDVASKTPLEVICLIILFTTNSP
ncbi:MAG: hypothetical protein Q8L69_04405 [Gallionellaceae bacterium]|nr:hypothetical protein [Gallionellaceae bacterium]